MAKRFLITRPTHDLITSYLHDFSKEIVKTVKETKDIHVTDLEGPAAIRLNLEKSLIKEEPGLVFLNGHGDRKRVAGHEDEIILDEKNINLGKDKIIYALSCDSLEDLGEIAIDIGAKAYIGYIGEFMWVGEPSKSSIPDKDKNAAPFRKACHVLIHSLYSGISVGKAIEKTKQEYCKLIRTYGTSEDDYGDAPAIGLALAWNLEYLDMCGDADAVF